MECRVDRAPPLLHFGDGIAGVEVNEDSFIVIAAELPGGELVKASIAVGPEGTCGCRISVGDKHLTSTAALTEVELLAQDREL